MHHVGSNAKAAGLLHSAKYCRGSALSVPLLQHSMAQIIRSLSVCLSSLLSSTIEFYETLHSGLRPETKMEFVRGQNPMMPSPILLQVLEMFTTPNAFSIERSNYQYRRSLTECGG